VRCVQRVFRGGAHSWRRLAGLGRSACPRPGDFGAQRQEELSREGEKVKREENEGG